MTAPSIEHSPIPSAWPLPMQLAAVTGEEMRRPGEYDQGAEDDADDGGRAPSRAEANGLLRRIIGERLMTARRLNGFDQCEFAHAMGFSNSTQPSLWEQGKRLPPLPLLIEAARTLGVSVDFLIGETDEFERDPKLAARAAVFRRVERLLKFNAEAVAECLLDACSSRGSDEIRVARFATRARALCEAAERFQDLNSETFEDARGGATLLRAGREMREALKHIERFLHRAEYARTNAIERARSLTLRRAHRSEELPEPH